jgi:hypothetical protein
MATRSEMLAALRAAHNAGDETAARRLATMVQSYDAQQPTSTLGKGFQTADDAFRIAADSMTRGAADKLLDATPLYGNEQEKTLQSRDRMPGWAEMPIDVGSAVIASPYRIGSMAAGAGWGALEGAGSTYMHQPNWIPSSDEAVDILKGGAGGAVAGAGGAKLGQWGGDIYSKLAGKTVANPQAGEKTVLGKVADFVEPMALRQKRSLPLWKRVVTEAGLAHLGVPPAVTTGGASLLNWLGKGSVKGATMVDPTAGAASRDALAKMMIGLSKYGMNR